MDFKKRVTLIRTLGFRSSEDLYAGFPMIYMCKICGGIADTRSESYNPRDYPEVKNICKACLKDLHIYTEKDMIKIVKKLKKEIPYKRDNRSGESASGDWFYTMSKYSK